MGKSDKIYIIISQLQLFMASFTKLHKTHRFKFIVDFSQSLSTAPKALKKAHHKINVSKKAYNNVT